MLFECWLQLRGEAPDDRQIDTVDPGDTLTHNLGGYPGEMVRLRGDLGQPTGLIEPHVKPQGGASLRRRRCRHHGQDGLRRERAGAGPRDGVAGTGGDRGPPRRAARRRGCAPQRCPGHADASAGGVRGHDRRLRRARRRRHQRCCDGSRRGGRQLDRLVRHGDVLGRLAEDRFVLVTSGAIPRRSPARSSSASRVLRRCRWIWLFGERRRGVRRAAAPPMPPGWWPRPRPRPTGSAGAELS